MEANRDFTVALTPPEGVKAVTGKVLSVELIKGAKPLRYELSSGSRATDGGLADLLRSNIVCGETSLSFATLQTAPVCRLFMCGRPLPRAMPRRIYESTPRGSDGTSSRFAVDKSRARFR